MDDHDYPPPAPDATPVTPPAYGTEVDRSGTAPVTTDTAGADPATGGEAPELSGAAAPAPPATRGRLPFVVAAVAIVIALIAAGVAGVALYRLNQVTATAAAAADELRDSVGALRTDLTELAASNDGSDLAAVTTRVERLELRNTILVQCVNEYMDVIGRWSSNVNSSFRWSYC